MHFLGIASNITIATWTCGDSKRRVVYDLYKFVATRERIITDSDDRVDRYARKVVAIIERILFDGGYAIGNVNTRQAIAPTERITTDGGDSVAYRYARQGVAGIERITTDGGDGFADYYARKVGATIERITTDGGDSVAYRYARQGVASIERILIDFIILSLIVLR